MKNNECKGVVYLAGPFRGDVEENRRHARYAANDLRKKGFVVIVPHLESCGCEASLDEEGWLRHGLALLRHSNYIALFGKWQFSKGTLLELNNAAAWGIPLVAVYDQKGDPLFCHNPEKLNPGVYECSEAERLSADDLKTLFGKPYNSVLNQYFMTERLSDDSSGCQCVGTPLEDCLSADSARRRCAATSTEDCLSEKRDIEIDKNSDPFEDEQLWGVVKRNAND